MPLFEDWRRWRRALKAALPYVRRREHRLLLRKYAALIEAVDGAATPAAQARLRVRKALAVPLTGDVCLFVSHATQPLLKAHVIGHIEHLLAAGWQVVLIVNTDHDADAFTIDPAFAQRLSAVLLRQNMGFDFAAWAHGLALCGPRDGWGRLLLVNDSVVGPLDASAFTRLMAQLRASPADAIGLTESLAPQRHLQSYFLAFNAAALRHPAWQAFFARVLNWPDKSQVIDVCETRLTALLNAAGLRCEALFPARGDDPLSSDDTSLRWQALIDAGFPYIKTRVLDTLGADDRARHRVADVPDQGLRATAM